MNISVKFTVNAAVMGPSDDGPMNSTISSPPTPQNLRGIRAQLEREWNRLIVDPTAIAKLESWTLNGRRFDSFSNLLHDTGYGCHDVKGSEALLRELVALAASERLAARCVLQRVLPGLVAAVRYRNRQMSPETALSDLIAAAWLVIATYDSRRNPSSVAAAIIDSAVYRAFKVERSRKATEPLEHVERVLAQCESNAVAELNELREVLCEAERLGMSKDDIRLVFSIATGTSTETLAKEFGITSRAVRYRSQRLVENLAAIAQIA